MKQEMRLWGRRERTWEGPWGWGAFIAQSRAPLRVQGVVNGCAGRAGTQPWVQLWVTLFVYHSHPLASDELHVLCLV